MGLGRGRRTSLRGARNSLSLAALHGRLLPPRSREPDTGTAAVLRDERDTSVFQRASNIRNRLWPQLIATLEFGDGRG